MVCFFTTPHWSDITVGKPTGTSGKFVDMMLQALDDFQDKHDVRFKKITKIPLEGEGTINKRVDR